MVDIAPVQNQAAGPDFEAARLGPWMEAHVEGFRGPVTATKFPGGQSNPTYRLESPSGLYVLRRKPFGPLLPSAHAVDREFRVISALHPTGFPVARPYALCEDEAVIGAPFYIMELVEGRTFWDGKLPEVAEPAQRRAVYESLINTLADLHNLDPAKLGMGDFGPPGNYFERQVRRWTKQYRAAQTDDLPVVEKLIEWLSATIPNQERVSIIHGDYRIDNVIFEAEGTNAKAVLDWELSTLGDPLADFAYVAVNWQMPGGSGAALGGLDLKALGIPTLEEATSLYCERTGRSGVPDLNWYFAYNTFRLLSIVQGIKKRFLDGTASSANAEQAGSRVPMLAEQSWEFAQRAGAR